MLKKLTSLIGGREREQIAQEPILDPITKMVNVLNQYPIGTRVEFNINFGPGIRTETVTAYIDPDLFKQSGGQSTELKIEGLPTELQDFLSS